MLATFMAPERQTVKPTTGTAEQVTSPTRHVTAIVPDTDIIGGKFRSCP